MEVDELNYLIEKMATYVSLSHSTGDVHLPQTAFMLDSDMVCPPYNSTIIRSEVERRHVGLWKKSRRTGLDKSAGAYEFLS